MTQWNGEDGQENDGNLNAQRRSRFPATVNWKPTLPINNDEIGFDQFPAKAFLSGSPFRFYHGSPRVDRIASFAWEGVFLGMKATRYTTKPSTYWTTNSYAAVWWAARLQAMSAGRKAAQINRICGTKRELSKSAKLESKPSGRLPSADDEVWRIQRLSNRLHYFRDQIPANFSMSEWLVIEANWEVADLGSRGGVGGKWRVFRSADEE